MEQDGEQDALSDPKPKWTPEEDNNLKILVKNFGNKDWKTVSSFLPGRSERQCMNRWTKSLSPVQVKGPWTDEEEDQQVKGPLTKSLSPVQVKGPWTEEEDQQIVELVAEYGTRSWPVVAQRLGGRVGKQCRERWFNHLDPQVDKSSWTRDQDLLIYRTQRHLGNRWADIARLLPGRTDNAVKNRWHTRIKKLSEQEAFRKEAEAVDLKEGLQKEPNEEETETRPVLSPRVKSQSSKSPDPSSRPQPGPKADPSSRPQPGPKADPSSRPQPGPKADPSSRPQPGPKADPSSRPQPGPKADPSSRPQPGPKADPSSRPQPGPKADPSSRPQPGPKADSSSRPQPGPKADPSSRPQPGPKADSSSRPQPGPKADPSSRPQPGPKADPSSRPHPGPKADPSSRPQPGPKPNPVPKPGPSQSLSPDAAVDQKTLEEAALKMIAEDMLPMSFVEGSGFRSFQTLMCPQYSRLSQRSLGLRLYSDVERTHKPQLIRDLKASLAPGSAPGLIHVSADLWAGSGAEAAVLVRLHFLNEAWRLCRPVVAFRRLEQDLSSSMCRELEGVLLSYGIFPQSIGYTLTSDAKHALTANHLFCDYTLVLNRAEAEGEETLSFLTDQLCDVAAPWCDLQLGTRWRCVGQRLQLVLEEALETCSDVNQHLSQLQSLVNFFRSKTSWSEMLVKACGAPLWPPPSSCRWNSSLQCWRRMLQESTWGCVLQVLDQAQDQAQTAAETPAQGQPVVSASREQLVDVLGLLGPLEMALQTLQASSSSLSSLIPVLLQLDRGLRCRVSSFAHFSRALRTGLRSHFQSLLHDQDALLATALDPRIKLKPFSEKPEQTDLFLCPPSKSEATVIIEAALASAATPALTEAATPALTDAATPVLTEAATPALTEAATPALTEAATPALTDAATPALTDESAENRLKRKASCALPEPLQKCAKASELQCYLTEPAAP